MDFKDLPGTNCLCDDQAKSEIKSRILNYLRNEKKSLNSVSDEKVLSEFAKGIHFIDSGNFHYMSALMLEMVSEPFSLVVLDHHPDMQPTMFGDILSCGSWVKEVLDKNENVQDVHVIGADRKLIYELDEAYRKKVSFYDKNDVIIGLSNMNGVIENFKINLPRTGHPVYLSIDKDVISKDYLETNWDQGEFTDGEVLEFVKAFLTEKAVIGMDICGECAFDQEGIDLDKAIAQNNDFNSKIFNLSSSKLGVNINDI